MYLIAMTKSLGSTTTSDHMVHLYYIVIGILDKQKELQNFQEEVRTNGGGLVNSLPITYC